MSKSRYYPDEDGFYGEFGGAFIPEMLVPNIKELRDNYIQIIESTEFRNEFHTLLRDYSGRPTPLYFARRLSEKYNTQVYLKREDLNHTGAHKINNTIGQVLLAEKLGKKRIIAETGAGQHGVATATVCALKGLECVVYMGALDVERQSPNVTKMKMLGAKVIAVQSGNKTLKDATNEAMRDWINHPDDTYYIIGSVVGPHPYPDLVTRMQSVISYELSVQLNSRIGRAFPDYVIACVGGGSNAAGGFFAFLENPAVKLLGAEAAGLGIDTKETAATLALGQTGILHGSKSKLIQDEYGQVTEPYSISAGLDYPGVGPLHSYLQSSGRCTYLPVTDGEALEAAIELTKLEGIIPALESAHALALLPKLNWLPEDQIVIILSGRGDKDMDTYSKNFDHESH
jgi:tryptophan synthase beta chain